MLPELREILKKVYTNQSLDPAELDYSILEQYRPVLERLSHITNSMVFVVDLYRFDYALVADNISGILGGQAIQPGNIDNYLDSRIHPEDYGTFKKVQLLIGGFLNSLPPDERKDYKHIYELRIMNRQQEYINVSWERKVLATDRHGQLWLMLGIINILPDQNPGTGLKNLMVNVRTGEQIPLISPGDPAVVLTRREKEVLQLIGQGLISKEIADRLSISIHTVNIHRQNILKKLDAGNSMEAVNKLPDR